MSLRRITLLVLTTGVVGLAVLVAFTRGPPPPAANLPGTFSFGAFGDSPYNMLEALRYRVVLEDIAAHDLRLVVHVGDLFWTLCTDERYQRSLEQFNSLPHPVIYTPGDNEWTDCWGHSREFAPLDRLERIRDIFFADPASSLGGSDIPLANQGTGGSFPQFVENARWVDDDIVFATFHLVGSGNGMAGFPGRTEADDAASARRTEAATAWLHETFAEARAMNASAVVLTFHANPGLEEPVHNPRRMAFEPFIEALEEEAALFALPVLVIHGDWHEYTVDHPLARRSTGEQLDNLTRLQVPGSPDVGWVRVTVTPGAQEPFAFEARVVPQWKHW